ncbi:hypothetical protein D3C78_893640 [compost metagenome]
MLDQGFTETATFLGVVTGHFERSTGHAHRLRGNADTPALKVGQGDLVTLPLLAQTIGNWNAHIVENDLAGVGCVLAELVFDPRHLVTR